MSEKNKYPQKYIPGTELVDEPVEGVEDSIRTRYEERQVALRGAWN